MQTAAIRKENTIEQTLDGFSIGFSNVEDMLAFHGRQDADSTWIRLPVNQIRVKALPDAPLLAMQVRSEEKIDAPLETLTDTIEGSGLLVGDGLGHAYCVRDTALKTILERASVSGAALSRLSRENLATVLNLCLQTGRGDALMLYRDGKVGAIHGGDEKDYSILPISELLSAFVEKNDSRFPGSVFDGGYTDPSVTTAEWSMPFQAAEILKAYNDALQTHGRQPSNGMTPEIRFTTSDVGISSATITAGIRDSRDTPIPIGSVLVLRHQHGADVDAFRDNLDEAFAKFADIPKLLADLLDIQIKYPKNAMTLAMKRLALPKKVSFKAIDLFDSRNGEAAATAYDVYYAMAEILPMLRSAGEGPAKVVTTEEILARALHFGKKGWDAFDLPGDVQW